MESAQKSAHLQFMKKIYWILILGIIGFGFGHGQEKFLPESHNQVFIGMSMDTFISIKGDGLEKSRSFSGTPQLTEYPQADTLFTETHYIFDKKGFLYEIIIDYKDHFELYQYLLDFYGAPNVDNKEWLITLENGRELYIWEYLNRWCIADGETYK